MTTSKKVFFLLTNLFLGMAFFCAGFFSNKLLVKNSSAEIYVETISLMDIEYKQRVADAVSNFEVCEINEEFSQRYEAIANEYYEQVISIADDTFKLAIVEEQTAWENYALNYLNSQLAYYEQLYAGGSIVPVICSQAKYDLYREKVLALIKTASRYLRPEVPVQTESRTICYGN